ncbi:MAG: PAS domain S-box protein [Methanoregula sp.]|uniref:PAS domain S-box protein n=1 Tax=Methanoregula sp. TaxID=2052170 RepID=UPI0025F90875|nr:PAS domain S-box protein [Methanoregula sp.]MCK9631207.1 PAS domain S-box protein [Methanoregula sp.]
MITVLYVDDEPELLEVTRVFLEQAGEFEVRISTSAREMLDSGTVPSCDAIVSDYQMPEMDGIAFLKEVRERFADLPFILFTGRGREEVAIEALNYGADFYIQKGGEPRAQFAELSNKIRYAVSRKRAEKELRRKNDELNASYEQIAANEEALRQQLDELTGKQEALKSSEEKFRAFTENIPDLTTIVDLTGVYTYISPSIQRITGWTEDKLLGKKFGGIDAIFGILPEEAEILLKCGRMAIQKPGEAIPVPPFRIRDFKGDILFIEGTNTYLPDVKGIQGILFHGREISDRVRAEEELRRKNDELNASYEQITASDEELRAQYEELALIGQQVRESEEKFRGIFEKIHDALILFTEDGCIDCNRHALELYGFPSKEEILGMLPADVSPPVQPDGQDSRSASAAHICAVFHKGVERFEWLHQKKDGSTFLADILLSSFELDGRQVFLSSVRDITEQKRNEEALRESEEKYRTLVENAKEVIAIVQDWTIVFVNRSGADLLGVPAGDLVGKPFMDYIWPEDRERIKALHSGREAGDTVADAYDFRIVGDEGRPVWVLISSATISWQGRPATLSLMTDITERKFIEGALHESEETFRRVIEGAPDAIYIGTDGKFMFLNPAALRLFGATSGEQLVGTPFLDRIHPKHHDIIRERVHQRYDELLPTPLLEEVYLKLDGTAVDVEVSSVPFRYMGRDGALVFVRDISEWKQAERARRESEEKYRSILEKMQDAYLRVDPDGKLTMANPAAARMFGYDSPEKMIGIPVISLYYNPGRRREIIKTLQEGGKVADVTERMMRMDRTTFWASLSVQSIRGDDGSLIATEGILRDITERKSMEQAIQEANRKLNLLNSINRHDVVNQLTVLQGYTQLAAMKGTDPVIADFLKKIEATANTIARQIEFTKTYQELGAQTPAWFRLDETVERSGRAEVRFSNTCRPVEIFADPMLERVFYNLFENAIRHGGHVTEIAIRCEREPDGLVIIIEDNGVGVVPEEKEKIFEKGFGRNTGFGLFLAREILAITGITIRETGYAGIGARFEITVPTERYRIAAGS